MSDHLQIFEDMANLLLERVREFREWNKVNQKIYMKLKDGQIDNCNELLAGVRDWRPMNNQPCGTVPFCIWLTDGEEDVQPFIMTNDHEFLWITRQKWKAWAYAIAPPVPSSLPPLLIPPVEA